MKTLHPAAALAATLAAGLTLAACQPTRDDAAADASTPAEAGAKALADKITDTVGDAAITVAVSTELAKDTALSVLHIEVDTVDGRVVLAGSAPDEAARQRATVLAQRVQGVKSVDNRLALAPLS